MTNFQKSFMAMFCGLGVLIGLILSESYGDKAFMNLAMGFVIPIFSLLLVPRNTSGFGGVFGPLLIVLLTVFASLRAANASLQIGGDFVLFGFVLLLTFLAMSVIFAAGRFRVTVSGKLPVVGRFSFKG